MVTSICPSCGRPRALSGGALHVQCAACGRSSAVEPELARAADAYRTALANAPLQLAQQADIERIDAEMNDSAARFRRAAGLLAGPLFLTFVIGICLFVLYNDEANVQLAFYAPAMTLPLVTLLALGFFAATSMRQRRRAVQTLLWARPLANAPGTLACRLCGGPLDANVGTTAVVACRFCHADNMLGPEVSRAAASLALTDYASQAKSLVGPRAERIGKGLARLALVGPLAVLVGMFVAERIAWGVLQSAHRPVDPAIDYVAVHCPGQPSTCIHHQGSDTSSECYAVTPVVSLVHADDLRGKPIWPASVTWKQTLAPLAEVHDARIVDVYQDGVHRHHGHITATALDGDALIDGICLHTAADGGAP